MRSNLTALWSEKMLGMISIFILSYLLSFLVYSIFVQPGPSPLITSSISISAGQNRPRAVWGGPKNNEL